ncbi:MAG: peptidase M64 [Candidatus Marinimicrobia bacterium]|nr:peptidase M64 [Candidatus Neomarinimicrobiota bacterium]
MRFLLTLILISSAWAIDFDSYFTGQTFRFDYCHNGTADEEHISFDQVRSEGSWPGSRTQLIDDTDLGKYYFEVIDLTSTEIIYSRGFCSIYGEWETTGDALAGNWGTFHESLRFPEPRAEVIVRLYKRRDDGKFREIYTCRIDPQAYTINRSALKTEHKIWNLFTNGDPKDKIDIVILGDGYTRKEKRKFHADTKRLASALFDVEPFHSRQSDFNVRAIDIFSPESGISNPRAKAWKQSALGLKYNTFNSDRYVLTYDNKTVREIAGRAPYDALIILVNSAKYGGGGIFNLYSTVAVDTEPAEYIMVHEFGHSFAGLGDEYYTSNVAYEEFTPSGSEPWEPNNTALLNPEHLKWAELVVEGTPIPTPWDQAAYDSARVNYQNKRTQMIASGSNADSMNALFDAVKRTTVPVLEANQYYGIVGAFEGAGYQAQRLYRPEIDCIMFSRNPDHFCRVCQAAITRVIDLYTK